MSGGSWDYVYSYFGDVAEKLKKSRDPLRRALGKQVELVGKAMRDIEWVDSGDSERGDDRPAIEAALGKNARALELNEVLIELRELVETARRMVEDEPDSKS